MKPKINLDGFVLTSDRILPSHSATASNGRSPYATPKRARESSNETQPDPGVVERKNKIAAEKQAAGPCLSTESQAEMLRRLHAERAETEREKARRERAAAMGNPVSSPSQPPDKPASILPLIVPKATPPRPTPSQKPGPTLTDLASGPAVWGAAPGITVAAAGPSSTIDPEIQAIGHAYAALAGLNERAARRAIDYLTAKLLDGETVAS